MKNAKPRQTREQRLRAIEHILLKLNERLHIVEGILLDNNLKQKEDEKDTNTANANNS